MIVIHSSHSAAVAWVDGTLVLSWRSHCDPEVSALCARELARVDSCHLLTHVPSFTRRPNDTEADAIVELLRTGNGRIRASAVAYTGGNFRAFVARAVAYQLAMSAALRYAHEPVGTLEDAITWLADSGCALSADRARLVIALRPDALGGTA